MSIKPLPQNNREQPENWQPLGDLAQLLAEKIAAKAQETAIPNSVSTAEKLKTEIHRAYHECRDEDAGAAHDDLIEIEIGVWLSERVTA